ncbi:MAG: hypothetical protein AMXMBFR33_67280 [Candidatus Xenobia bacterium]
MRKRSLDLPILLVVTAILVFGESRPSPARYDPDGAGLRIEGILPSEHWKDSAYRRLLPDNMGHSRADDGTSSVKGRVLTQGTVVLLKVGDRLTRAQQVFPGGKFGHDGHGNPYYSIGLPPLSHQEEYASALTAEGDRQGRIRSIWLYRIPNHPSPNG